MSVGTVSAENIPRDLKHIMEVLRPSIRFRVMNQLGAFDSREDMVAYSSAPPDVQAERLLAVLQQLDAGGGVSPKQQGQQMQLPQVPQVQPMQQPAMPQQPMQQQSMQPQMGSQAAPAAPMVSMPGALGLPQQQQPQAAPVAPSMNQAAPSMNQAAPAVPAPQDPRQPSFMDDPDPLATIITNQQKISTSIHQLAQTTGQLVHVLNDLKNQSAGSNRITGTTLLLLTTFVEAAMQRSRQDIAAELGAALNGGELEQFLQSLGGQQG